MMQYALEVQQNGVWRADVSVPSAEDAGIVCQTILAEHPLCGVSINAKPIPHMPEGMALPIDHEPFGALNVLRRTLSK